MTASPYTPREDKKALINEKNDLYKQYLQELTPEHVSKEITDTLNILLTTGYKLAIGSSSRNAKLIINKTDLGRWFSVISDGDGITRSKPDPEVFLRAATQLQVEPEECTVIEDASAGIQAGRNAGMMTIAIGNAADLEAADCRVVTFFDIIDMLT